MAVKLEDLMQWPEIEALEYAEKVKCAVAIHSMVWMC